MTAKQLFEQGKVREAQQALSAWLRDHPTDAAQRTFLFELLCFSGDWERAAKHLALLGQSGKENELGAILYFAALHAERTRHELFEKEEYPKSAARADVRGLLNGKPFTSLSDLDPVVGARLEIFAAGSYLWLPFEHLQSLRMEAPRKLRDTLWAPAVVQAGPAFEGAELGEVLIPAIYPFSWKDSDESVWLGRSTEVVADERGREYPIGQKTLLVDGEEVPLLEVRTLEIETGHAAAG